MPPVLEGLVAVSEWSAGAPPTPELTPSEDVTRWFEIESGADVNTVAQEIIPLCERLTEQVVADVLTADPRPELRRLGADDIRSLMTFKISVTPPGPEIPTGPGSSDSRVLVFEPLKLVAGPGWLLSCCHDRRAFRGTAGVPIEPKPAHGVA